MTLFGLHILDVAIIAAYIVVILWLGKRAGRDTRNTSDFYIAGRRLGKFYQFFLNFGNSTDVNQAAGVSREIYRQGLGGMWIQFLVLFLTPFYWFTTMLFRRSRLITIGDFFTERFASPFLGGAFAVFTLTMAVIGGGASYMVAGKTMMALTPKPASEYTQTERLAVDRFHEYRELKSQMTGGLSPEQQTRFDELHDRYKRGELRAFISYVRPIAFYVVYALIVAAYTVLGGFTAAAITDAIQGVLIVTFSIMLIPIGLKRVGGFEGLHATVPDYLFELFGSASTSEYAWYTVLAMIVANLVSIVAAAPMMATAGSAKDEWTARVGMLGGMFFKRFIMLLWALAGLLAIALYGGTLDDPDHIWGHMTRELLFPGAIGLMFAGILAANMSSLDAGSVTNSALFIRNLYQPRFPGKSERHYINVGRIVIVLLLAAGVVTALHVNSLLSLFKYFIALPAIFGAAIWLGFTWRRLTRMAVIIQVVVCFTLIAVIPNLFQQIDAVTANPKFLVETEPREVFVVTGALAEDVEAGLADAVGQPIRRPHRTPPTGIFFENVVRSDPSDPNSPRVGEGRFNAEVWVLSWFGVDFSGCTKAHLEAIRFGFDAIVPFVLLVLLSYATPRVSKQCLDAFYAKIHTPVQSTPERDSAAIELATRQPNMHDSEKLLPGSDWEILRPGRADFIGFGGSWVIVGVVLLLLWLLATIGS